jgi:hypothetical protein
MLHLYHVGIADMLVNVLVHTIVAINSIKAGRRGRPILDGGKNLCDFLPREVRVRTSDICLFRHLNIMTN